MKKVLITGGSCGIGAQCVRDFCVPGYKVYFTYNKNCEKAKEIENETGATAVKCNLSISGEVNKLLSLTGDVDVLVNNAGISQIKMLQDISEDDWDNMFDINIKSMFLTSKLYVNNMIRNKWGRIINISSMWGQVGASCEVHYSASKAAVIGFTKALAKELAPSGITVNCIAPGAVKTDMNSNLSEEDIRELCNETPLMRMGEASEISKAAVYIASEDAAFITGQVLGINGGLVI